MKAKLIRRGATHRAQQHRRFWLTGKRFKVHALEATRDDAEAGYVECRANDGKFYYHPIGE